MGFGSCYWVIRSALLVYITLSNQIQVRGQNVQITNVEEMNKKQKKLFKELAQ